MIKRHFTLALLLIFIIVGNSCKKRDKESLVYDKSFIKPIKLARKEVITKMRTGQLPSSSVAISVKGKTVWSEAVGYANLELKAKPNRATKYRIGSASKIITSMAYYLLNEQGKFGSDTLVGNYYPEFENKKHQVSLTNLAKEASGIRLPTVQESSYQRPGTTLQKGIQKFVNDTLLFIPGKFQLKNDFNYNLLGSIMEKKMGGKFNSVIKEALLDTLKMTNTQIDFPLSVVENRATTYARNIVSQRTNSLFNDYSSSAPSIGLLSTADDFLKLGNAVLYSELFSDSFKSSYFKSNEFDGYSTNEANGWEILADREGNVLYHVKASVTGGAASLIIYPKEEIVISWLTNISEKHEGLSVFQLLDYFIKFQNGESLEPKKEKE